MRIRTNKYVNRSFFFPHLQQFGTRWDTELWPALRFRRLSACGCVRGSISHGIVSSWFLYPTHTKTHTHTSFLPSFCLSVPFPLLFFSFTLYPLCAFYLNRFMLGRFWCLSHIVHLGVQINLESHLWRNNVSPYCFGKYSMSRCIGLHLAKLFWWKQPSRWWVFR